MWSVGPLQKDAAFQGAAEALGRQQHPGHRGGAQRAPDRSLDTGPAVLAVWKGPHGTLYIYIYIIIYTYIL